ncbi:MAG: hypothetical protein ISR77_14175 [Pirellulaceae bacterium]|nr:hypothetical protein [Pirellulaceae bacterium]
MRDRPDLASCAVHCCHCGIRFLTHPRNANRRDLRCPFGCREYHRRQQANQRSKKHYRTDGGRKHKKRLNGKRSTAGGGADNGAIPDAVQADTAATDRGLSSSDTSPALDPSSQSAADLTHQPTQAAVEKALREVVKLTLESFTLDEVTLMNSFMLPYLAMVASVIEGRIISREELLYVLRRSMRQRSFDRLPRREYVLRFLDQHPP